MMIMQCVCVFFFVFVFLFVFFFFVFFFAFFFFFFCCCFFFNHLIFLFIKGIFCGYPFELQFIQMGIHNICLYKETDKKYTGCNLKTTELFG